MTVGKGGDIVYGHAHFSVDVGNLFSERTALLAGQDICRRTLERMQEFVEGKEAARAPRLVAAGTNGQVVGLAFSMKHHQKEPEL